MQQRTMEIGYKLSSYEHGPADLVKHAPDLIQTFDDHGGRGKLWHTELSSHPEVKDHGGCLGGADEPLPVPLRILKAMTRNRFADRPGTRVPEDLIDRAQSNGSLALGTAPDNLLSFDVGGNSGMRRDFRLLA